MAPRVILFLLLAAQLLAAQNSFDEALAKWADHPPDGFSLTLERLSGPVLNEGELVQIRVQHISPYQPRSQDPRPPLFYQFAGFLMSPSLGDCGTLEQPCLPTQGIVGGLFRDPLFSVESGQRPVETDMNAYVPHLPPGSYRVAIVMQKEVLKSSTAQGAVYGYTDPREYLVSNAIEFEVQPASDDWVSQTLESERKTLIELMSQAEGGYFGNQRAARQIGAINRSEAHRVALEILGSFRESQVHRDVTRSLARDVPAQEACDLLRSRLSVPEQKLNTEYADFMGRRCAEAGAPLTEELKATPNEDPRRAEHARNYQMAQVRAMQQGMVALAQRAQEDVPESRTMRLQVLEYGVNLLNQSRTRFFVRDLRQTQQQGQATLPPFVTQTAARVVRELPGYTSAEVITVLSDYWLLVRQANPEAALRSIIGNLEGPAEECPYIRCRGWVDARREAIRRLVELNPQHGRAVLLDEVTHFRPTFDATLADLLPREAVPPMDDALLDYLSNPQPHDASGPSAILLISHYLTAVAADRLKNAIDAMALPGLWCEPELLAYFLRAQPATAESVLQRTPWDMHKPIDTCGLHWMSGVPPLAMNPALEDYLIAHLHHEAVNAKQAAAEALSQYGTARGQKPLEDAFQYFHEYWKGRQNELDNPNYRDGWMLELSLRNAIARGQAWLTDEAALRKLADACMTQQCRSVALEDLAQWDSKPLPLRITGPDQQGRENASIGHYLRILGIEAIKQKLAQFPRGTEFSFQVFVGPSTRDRITSELRGVADEAGLVLK